LTGKLSVSCVFVRHNFRSHASIRAELCRPEQKTFSPRTRVPAGSAESPQSMSTSQCWAACLNTPCKTRTLRKTHAALRTCSATRTQAQPLSSREHQRWVREQLQTARLLSAWLHSLAASGGIHASMPDNSALSYSATNATDSEL
jgi:hypothetical protein